MERGAFLELILKITGILPILRNESEFSSATLNMVYCQYNFNIIQMEK